jgi:hypothetical protein
VSVDSITDDTISCDLLEGLPGFGVNCLLATDLLPSANRDIDICGVDFDNARKTL